MQLGEKEPCGQAIDGGRETDIKFNKAGRFTVEGYGVTAGGNSKDAKTQKQSAVATLTIEENKLAGVQRRGGSGSTEYRFEEPAVYELTTLFPVEKTPLPRRQTLENVVWTVLKKDGAGEPVLVSAGTHATVTCTAPCDYVVIATLGETAQSSPRMKAIKNAITAVSASLKSCRPGEEVVLKAKFRIEPALPAELALLKWTCKDGKGVEHKEGLVSGSQEQRLRLKPVGHYKVWAFVNSPSKTVMAEFEVTQPKIKLVQWVYPDKETGKKVTGWEEENRVKMVFESAQGLGAEATVGVLRDNAFHPVMKPFSFTVGKDNEDSFHFVLSKEHFKGKVKEGDCLTVRINCTTPGQSIAGGDTHMLQFTEKEGLGGIAFYKGNEKVNQAHYGDTLRCRVYGRNLSVGKARVVIGRFESFGGRGPQFPVLVENQTVIIGELGYGEFDFFLDVNKAKGTKSTIHKFGAWIQEAEVGGKHVFVKPEEAKGVQMLFVPVPVGIGKGAHSEAGIERGDDDKESSEDICECEAKVRAFMRTLRVGENTVGEAGYTRMFGGRKFSDLSTHPQKVIMGSSAAGAYQIMGYTYKWLNGMRLEWEDGFLVATKIYEEAHDYIKQYSVKSYSPADQDLLCVIILRHKLDGIIDLIINDNLRKAIHDFGSAEWASLPFEHDVSRHLYKGKPQPVTRLVTVLKNYDTFLKEEKSGISDLHLEKGFLDLVGVKCCKKKSVDKSPITICDSTKCIGSEDLFGNPVINNQSNNKNKNRFKRVPRIKKDGTSYYHTGVDILAVSGTPVHSLLCGTVISIESKFKPNQWVENSYGNTVVIKSHDKDGNIVFIKYCHFDYVDVIEDQEIAHGQTIGKSGSTGNAGSIFSGTKLIHGIYPQFRHVHVEASRKGTFKGNDRIEPEDFMQTKFDKLGNKIN